MKVEKYLEDHSQKPSFGTSYDTSAQYYDPNQMVSTYNSGPEPWSQVVTITCYTYHQFIPVYTPLNPGSL